MMNGFDERGPLEGVLPGQFRPPLNNGELEDVQNPVQNVAGPAIVDKPLADVEKSQEPENEQKPEDEATKRLYQNELFSELQQVSGHKRKELYKYQKGKYSTIFMFMKHFPSVLKKESVPLRQIYPDDDPDLLRLKKLMSAASPDYKFRSLDKKPIFVIPSDPRHKLGNIEMIKQYLKTFGDVVTPTIDKGGNSDYFSNIVLNLYNRVSSYNWSSPERPVVLVGISISLGHLVECAWKLVEKPPTAIICLGSQIPACASKRESEIFEIIDVPVLFVVGENDDTLSMSNLAAIRRQFVNSSTTTVVMGGCNRLLEMSEARKSAQGLNQRAVFLMLVEVIRDYLRGLVSYKNDNTQKRKSINAPVPETLLEEIPDNIREILERTEELYVYDDTDDLKIQKEKEDRVWLWLKNRKIALQILNNDLVHAADVTALQEICKKIISVTHMFKPRTSLLLDESKGETDIQSISDQDIASMLSDPEVFYNDKENSNADGGPSIRRIHVPRRKLTFETMIQLADDLVKVKAIERDVFYSVLETLKVLHQEKFSDMNHFLQVIDGREKNMTAKSIFNMICSMFFCKLLFIETDLFLLSRHPR